MCYSGKSKAQSPSQARRRPWEGQGQWEGPLEGGNSDSLSTEGYGMSPSPSGSLGFSREKASPHKVNSSPLFQPTLALLFTGHQLTCLERRFTACWVRLPSLHIWPPQALYLAESGPSQLSLAVSGLSQPPVAAEASLLPVRPCPDCLPTYGVSCACSPVNCGLKA